MSFEPDLKLAVSLNTWGSYCGIWDAVQQSLTGN